MCECVGVGVGVGSGGCRGCRRGRGSLAWVSHVGLCFSGSVDSHVTGGGPHLLGFIHDGHLSLHGIPRAEWPAVHYGSKLVPSRTT